MKKLILIAGNAGVGKSTLAGSLAYNSGLVILDKDTLTQPLVEALAAELTGDPHDRHSETYLEKIRPLEYKSLMNTTWQVMASTQVGAILVAPFVKELHDEDWVKNLTNSCKYFGYELKIIWVTCDPERQKAQLVQRGAERDKWKLDNWDEWVEGLLPAPSLEHLDYIVVKMNGNQLELQSGGTGAMLMLKQSL